MPRPRCRLRRCAPWFTRFPRAARRPTGESYAGVYVPKAQQVLADADARGPGGDALGCASRRRRGGGHRRAARRRAAGRGGRRLPVRPRPGLEPHVRRHRDVRRRALQSGDERRVRRPAAANDASAATRLRLRRLITRRGRARRRRRGAPRSAAVNDHVRRRRRERRVAQPAVRDALHGRATPTSSAHNGDGMTTT